MYSERCRACSCWEGTLERYGLIVCARDKLAGVRSISLRFYLVYLELLPILGCHWCWCLSAFVYHPPPPQRYQVRLFCLILLMPYHHTSSGRNSQVTVITSRIMMAMLSSQLPQLNRMHYSLQLSTSLCLYAEYFHWCSISGWTAWSHSIYR